MRFPRPERSSARGPPPARSTISTTNLTYRKLKSGPDGAALHPRVLQALDGVELVVLSIGGNEHNVLAIAQASPRIRFRPRQRAGSCRWTGRRRSSRNRFFARRCATGWGSRLRRCAPSAQATAAPVIQVEPPPPLPREQVLAYPKEFFRTALAITKGFARPAQAQDVAASDGIVSRDLCRSRRRLCRNAAGIRGRHGMLARPPGPATRPMRTSVSGSG